MSKDLATELAFNKFYLCATLIVTAIPISIWEYTNIDLLVGLASARGAKMNFVAESEITDNRFMKRALLVSQKALPACLPNPPVGCVLVSEGAVLSEGYTHAPGQFHAEAHAVSQIDSRLDGLTAYVTLEPCSFRGRTPSCALMLVERGVSRVVVSLLDPDPRNNGKGISILRDAGIAVTIGILESEVRKFIGQHLNLPANRFPSCGCPDYTRD